MKLTVSKFAQIADTTVRTLRHYRQQGVLVPTEKNEKQQNVYTIKEFKKFHNIQVLKSLGLSLKEIKDYFEEPEYSFEEMIDIQEKVLVRKKEAIDSSLEMIDRIKSINDVDRNKELDVEISMLLMNLMRFEKVQRDIFGEYYSKEFVNKYFPKDKSKQKEIDKLNMNLLNIVNNAVINDYSPNEELVQEELKELMLHSPLKELSIETEETNEELYEKLEPYISLLPNEMVNFLAGAIEVLLESQE